MMRRLLAICGLTFLLVSPCQAGDDDNSSTILGKAIAAHGGAKALTKPRMGVLKGKSKDHDFDLTQEETFDLPKRWKRVTVATVEGKPRRSFALMSDKVFWEWEEGGKPKKSQNLAEAVPYLSQLTLLVDLAEQKAKLSALEETRINGESAIGFRAIWNGKASDYYFQKATGLLLSASFKWQWEPGKEYDVQCILGEYKDVDGIKLAYRRSYRLKGGAFKDYVPLRDFSVTEIRILDRIPQEAFKLPE